MISDRNPELEPRTPLQTFYRVWWALGGYRHYDTWADVMSARHPEPHRRYIDEPSRIDKIEVVYRDDDAEARVQKKRRSVT